MARDTFNADHAKAVGSSVDTRLQAALSSAKSVNGGRAPSSFGRKRSQNRSPAMLGQETRETQDVVPGQRTAGCGEPVGARATARTPHLLVCGVDSEKIRIDITSLACLYPGRLQVSCEEIALSALGEISECRVIACS
jgi:hypothetical protein